MSFVITRHAVFFVVCQLIALSVLWAVVENNYLLTIVHVSLWASLAFIDNVVPSVAMLAFACTVIYAVLAILMLKTDKCYVMNSLNCVLSFIVKFGASVVCGLVDLSVYELMSSNKVFKKTLMFALCHVVSLSTQWAISNTSTHVIVLVIAHAVHWAWFPHANKISTALCGAVALQLLFTNDTFGNGSLLSTAIFCLAIDAWLLNSERPEYKND